MPDTIRSEPASRSSIELEFIEIDIWLTHTGVVQMEECVRGLYCIQIIGYGSVPIIYLDSRSAWRVLLCNVGYLLIKTGVVSTAIGIFQHLFRQDAVMQITNGFRMTF